MKSDGFNPKKAQIARMDESVDVKIYTKEYLEQVTRYNESIRDVDTSYSRLGMLNGILVRLYVYEVKVSESGLIEPFNQMLEVKTANGMRQKSVEIPVPFSIKAVVVSAPNTYTMLKAGQVIQLRPEAIQNIVMGDAKGGHFVTTKNAFTKIGKFNEEQVNTIDSPNFGYVIIQYGDIQCILEDVG